MALRNSKPVTVRPRGVSDAVDGSNAFPGAMAALTNLVPSPTTAQQWVPRPASLELTTFPGFTSPAQVNALLQVGNIVYGMIAETSGTYAGKDVPFAYNLTTNTFQTITIPGGAASLPATPVASGDWTPPTMKVIGSRVVITHPGYAGGASPFFGWLDISGFTSTTITGNTNSSTAVNNLASNVLQAGWEPGMTISDSAGDIPANTTIKSIAANGLSLVLSQAATGTNATTFTVSGGTATAPLYGAGNTNGNALVAVPLAVFGFSGRAYYAVGNGVVLSDAGNATQVTNATQVLLFNNGLAVTALGGLPFNQTQGGLLQALIAFQGDSMMQQITGDPTTSNLVVNALGIGVGTLAPNTICQTILGLGFVAPDGFRILTFAGAVSEPIGADGEGVCYPFLSAVNPTRMCAAFNQNVLRVSVQNGAAAGQPMQEYWFDFKLKAWSGPHTFPAALIEAYQGSPDHGFTLAPAGVNAALFSSSATPSVNDTYVENGSQMTFLYKTVLFPDTGGMSMNSLALATLACAISRNQNWTLLATDEQGNLLDQISLAGPNLATTVWDSFTWGAALWNGPGTFFFQQPLNWKRALVFKQMTLQITGNCALGTILGNLNLLIAQLGYLTQAPFVQPQVAPVPAQKTLVSDGGLVLVDDAGHVLTTD